MNITGLSGRVNGVNYKGLLRLGFQIVAVERINGVTASWRHFLRNSCVGVSPGKRLKVARVITRYWAEFHSIHVKITSYQRYQD